MPLKTLRRSCTAMGSQPPRWLVRLSLTFGLAVAAAGASAATCTTEIPDRVPTGDWGGEHVSMVVSDSGALLEYDCATGRITEPLRLDSRGDFEWSGAHVPGHGGPVRIDEPFDSLPARYAGHATRDRITMTLSIPGSTLSAQTFSLVRGSAPAHFKCL